MANFYPIKKKPLQLFGLIIFFISALFPSISLAVVTGDTIQATDGNYYIINSIIFVGSDQQSYDRVTSEGGTPCQDYNYYNGSDLRIYQSGFNDGQDCQYQRTITQASVTTPPPPAFTFSVEPFSYGLGLVMAAWVAGLTISQVFKVMKVIV